VGGAALSGGRVAALGDRRGQPDRRSPAGRRLPVAHGGHRQLAPRQGNGAPVAIHMLCCSPLGHGQHPPRPHLLPEAARAAPPQVQAAPHHPRDFEPAARPHPRPSHPPSQDNSQTLAYRRRRSLDFHRALDETAWLHHLSSLLRGAIATADAIHVRRRSVLVHCSDGWDRTMQVRARLRCAFRSSHASRSISRFVLLAYGSTLVRSPSSPAARLHSSYLRFLFRSASSPSCS
jgi:hypothetical protein